MELGVRLVLSEAGEQAAGVLALELPQDIAELCSDAAVPATAALLAIDGEQARAATAAGLTVDLAQFTRSQSRPDVYYVLFDHASRRRSTRCCTGSCPPWSRTWQPPEPRPVDLPSSLQDRDTAFDLPSGSPAAAPRRERARGRPRLCPARPGAHRR